MSTALSAVFLISCAAKKSNVELSPLPPAARGTRLELSEYLPSPGLRWLVHLRPRQLSRDEKLLSDWSLVFNGERLSSFRKASGFSPRHVEELWIAGYSLGTLYLFDARIVGEETETAFRSRSMSTAEVRTDFDDLIHVTGVISEKPHALVHLQQHFVAIVEGDLTLAKIIAAYVGEKLKRSPPALRSRLLAPLDDFEKDAPLRAFLVGPFEDATDSVAQGYVSGALAVHHKAGNLILNGDALGVWPTTPLLEKRLANWMTELLDTRELRALGWGFPLAPPTVTCPANSKSGEGQLNLTRCKAEGTWVSSHIADATHRITSASAGELLSEKAPDGWRAETHAGEAPKRELPIPPERNTSPPK